MRVIVGSHRKQLHIPDALASLDEHVTGMDDLVFIDDSGDPDNAIWLKQYGKVIETGKKGYTGAMKAACEAADGQRAFWLEEDFTFLTDVDLNELSDILDARPHLAQIALLRGPIYGRERRHGGIIEHWRHDPRNRRRVREVDGIIEQTVVFTTNPSMWQAEVFASGWPSGKGTERLKTRKLLREGYKFGFLPGVRVAHHGELKTGFGY